MDNISLSDFIGVLRANGVNSVSLYFGDGIAETVSQEYTVGNVTETKTVTKPISKQVEDEPDKFKEDLAEIIKEAVKPTASIEPMAAKDFVAAFPKCSGTSVKKAVNKDTDVGDCSYERFVFLVEQDSGEDANGHLRKAILASMKLDDLLRVNNDFGLGIDTDKPTEELSKEIAGYF